LSVFATTSAQWAEFADGLAVVIGWPIGIYVDDDPWLKSGYPSGWFWYFLAIEDTFDKPKRWSRCCQVQVLRFAQQSRQFACVVHGYLSPAALGLSRKTIN